MKIVIDTIAQSVSTEGNPGATFPLYSAEALEMLSRLWTKVGWNQKYVYTFSWLGRPVIQLPSDLVRLQEAIFEVRPDVIIETGVAHGGSLVFYATICKALGRGRVIGVDVEIRAHNRAAIEGHELASFITLVEGDSTAPATIARVTSLMRSGERVLVILDSDHSKAHVTRELEAYHAFVTPGSYIVATDGIMGDLHDVPRGQSTWISDNPRVAAEEFVATHPEFRLEPPARLFDESAGTGEVTYWPAGWLKRLSQ